VFEGGGSTSTFNATLGTTSWHNIVISNDAGITTLFYDGAFANTVVSGAPVSATNSFNIGSKSDGTVLASAQFCDVSVYDTQVARNGANSLYAGTSHLSTVQICSWFTDDDNTFSSLADEDGSGSYTLLGSAQYRNTSGSDSSCVFAYKINTGYSGLLHGRIIQSALGGDPYNTASLVFYEYLPPQKILKVNQAVKRSSSF
jgi:hypothetical protein